MIDTHNNPPAPAPLTPGPQSRARVLFRDTNPPTPRQTGLSAIQEPGCEPKTPEPEPEPPPDEPAHTPISHAKFTFPARQSGSITVVTDWIDVSVPLRNGMVHWPGDPPYRIHHVHDQKKGDACTVSQVTMGVHTGTHMDAPLHFIEDAQSIDLMPLDTTVGPARVIAIDHGTSIGRAELEKHQIEPNERLLFKTANSGRLWNKDAFDENFVFIDASGADYLAERAVRMVGVDYLSVGGFRQDAVETHLALLGAGIWVVEGLDLSHVAPGRYEFVCLPLKLVDSDGAPARAILRSVV